MPMAINEFGQDRLLIVPRGRTAIQLATTIMIVSTPAMTPVLGGIGFTLCTPGVVPCDLSSLFMPAGPLAPDVAAGHLFATATLTAPTNIPPPRGFGFSADKFAASLYQIDATYDRADEGLGRADVTQGLIVLTPLN